MVRLATRLALGCLLTLSEAAAIPGALDAQIIPGAGPPFSAVEATWSAFWERLLHRDIAGARRHLHSSQQQFPGGNTAEDLQELARQMRLCRVEPQPLPVSPDEVIYPVRCEHGEESVETLLGLRRDRDGSWRLVIF